MTNDLHTGWTDEDYARQISGATRTNPLGDIPNDLYTEYPTVVASIRGEPRAASYSSYSIALSYALALREFVDEGTRPTLIFTERYWSIH